MSDSINEQRCEHGKTEPHRAGVHGLGMVQYDCPGPSVVTPPAQNEQRPNYCGHESTHAPHLNCCGYQVEFPFSAAPSVSTDIDNLRAENARLTRERDLAIAHDTQPYPTAWAYEQACRVMHETKAERDALQAEVEELRRRKRAAEFWERLVRTVVARPEWRTFYEADERGACDEVMIDFLAALQARIDAVTALHTKSRRATGFSSLSGVTSWAETCDYCSQRHVGGYETVRWPCDTIAALGVDPQKETQQ